MELDVAAGTRATAADLDNGGGFGLRLVELLATRWGVNRTGGTLVWFEMVTAAAAR